MIAAPRSRRAVLAACLLLAGCGRGAPRAEDVRVEWELPPGPLSTGPARVSVGLFDDAGRPVRGARLHLEGHMRHPGMAPTIGELREGADGHYAGQITFSMGGDWVLLLSGELPDGRRIRRQRELRGVLPER